MPVDNGLGLRNFGLRKEKGMGIRKISGSMTVEASYVMAMVILALAVLIRTAYFQCRRTTEVMRLHYVVEQLRYREEEQTKMLSHGRAERNSAQAEGYVDGRTWRKEITAGIYEPEEVLRKIAIFERDNEVQKAQEE